MIVGRLIISNVEASLGASYQTEVLKVGNQVGKLLEEHLSLMLSEVEFLADIISTKVEHVDELEFDLLHTELKSELFYDLYLIKKDGSSQSLKGQKADNSDQEYFEVAMQGKSYISNPTISNFDQKNVIVYAVPIMKDNQVFGILGARNTVDEISNLLLSNVYTEKVSMYVVTDSIDLIASNRDIQPDTIPILAENIKKINVQDEIIITSEDGDFQLTSHEKHSNLINFKKLNDSSNWYLLSMINDQNMDYYMNITKYSVAISVILISVVFIWISLYIVKIKIQNLKNIEKIAYTHPVTGLCNYDGFIIEANRMLRKQVSPNSYIIIFDIKGFKLLNEIYGYPKGDELLKEIGEQVKSTLLPSQNILLGKFSNDLFALMIEVSICSPIIPILVEKIQASVHKAGQQCLDINLKANIGIYKCSKNEQNLKLAIDHADMARLHSKTLGAQSYYVFDEALWRDKTNLLFIEKELKQAIERCDFEVYYQPKINPYTNEISSAEALVRWIHPEKGFINPGIFIPIAEKSGGIVFIGCQVFESVCLMLKERKLKQLPNIPISINLSRVELYQQDLISFLKQMIEKYEIDPNLIEIEITETTALNDINVINEKIEAIHDLGMSVSMDDFGTGNSTFSNLKNVEIDVLKVDRSFSLDIESNSKSKEMLRCIIQLAKRIGLSVVCEGIETEEQVQILKEMDCDLIQGYYYAKPMPKSQFEQFIDSI